MGAHICVNVQKLTYRSTLNLWIIAGTTGTPVRSVCKCIVDKSDGKGT